jgi:hypothetical protein
VETQKQGFGIDHDYHETYDGHEFSPYMRDLAIACAQALTDMQSDK